MSSTQQRKFHVIASLVMLASFALITVTLACSLRTEPTPAQAVTTAVEPPLPQPILEEPDVATVPAAPLPPTGSEIAGKISEGPATPRFAALVHLPSNYVTLSIDDQKFELTPDEVDQLRLMLKNMHDSGALSPTGALTPSKGEGTPAKSFAEVRDIPRPVVDGEPRWVTSEEGTVHWSANPAIVHAYHLGNKKTAQAQADKMNELGLGALWEAGRSIAEINEIREQLRGQGLVSFNYMD